MPGLIILQYGMIMRICDDHLPELISVKLKLSFFLLYMFGERNLRSTLGIEPQITTALCLKHFGIFKGGDYYK